MSLIRQIWLLLLAVLLLAIGGGVAVNLLATRDTLQTQLRIKNSDNANALALVLSQARSDPATMALMLSAPFDTGFYRSIRFTPADGQPGFERHGESKPAVAPAWFTELLPIDSEPGVAQVSDGWRPLGQLEVVSHVSFAYDDLWRGGVHAIWLMLGVGALAGLLAAVLVARLRRPLDATIEQAAALVDGRYVIVDEPKVPELQRLAAAMNAMVLRVRSLFEVQAAQAETLRRQAYCDNLTGLPHRAHFMGRLGALLQREDGTDGGGLVLVRLANLVDLNLTLGRQNADGALLAIAQVLLMYPERVPECLVGRLNGSDFALCLPAAGMAAETAESIAAALHASLPAFGAAVQVHVGAVELRRDTALSELMAQADNALARAEARGAFAVEVVSGGGRDAGERAWRSQVMAALEQKRIQLVEFAVLDRNSALVHLECPLRVQLDPEGPFEAAARWLPLATRNRLTGAVDNRSIALALEAIAADGVARSVNVAAASLAEAGFAAHLRHRLLDRPGLARQLWIEVSERAALEQFDLVQEFALLLRPLGVRVGIEHAGPRLHQIERLYELGLHYVKLDAALCAGVARSDAAREFVRSTVALLHALSIQVQAEGLADAADVDVLWGCGVDAVTGPWASTRHAGAA